MATNHEKQKRGSFISFYKSGSIAGNYAQTHDPMAPVPAAAASNNINKPRSWLNMKKLRSGGVAAEIKRVDDRSIIARKERGGRGGQVIVEGRRSFSHTETCSRLPVDREKVMVAARRSVSDQVESTNVASVISFLQVKVLVSDMPGFMQVHAFQCARRTYDSLEKFSSKHMAYNMKKEFDKVYGPAWHCIVGSSFGSFVTHGTGCFLYFSMEKLYVLLFKTKVQRALD